MQVRIVNVANDLGLHARLAASMGSTISIEAIGPDDAEAVEALSLLIGDRHR